LAEQKPAKKRVVAYCRVSTDLDEQQNSYEAQVDYYGKYIPANPEWELLRIYADEGITGTSLKKRDEFNQMVEDALAGKFDLIVTKAVSRFARNTLDSIATIRKLKAAGVGVYFEEMNINTLESTGELLITILSAVAQEESNNISQNVTWGKRKRMGDGKVTMSYKHFLGYEKGADGEPQIVESEAVTIRQIYAMFLAGHTYREIAAHLTANGVLTPAGKTKWAVTTVRSILRNEKYSGNAILQKTYTADFLTKRMVENDGSKIPKLFVKNSHPAIISEEIFEVVQDEIRRREALGKKLSGSGLFVGKIFCGECGGVYGHKTLHSKAAYKKDVLRCNNRYKKKGAVACRIPPHLTYEQAQTAFVRAWNALIAEKARYIAEYEAAISLAADTSAFDKQTAVILTEYDEAEALRLDCVAESAQNPQSQEEYERRYDEVVERKAKAKAALDNLTAQKQAQITQKVKMERFLKILQAAKSPPTAFDEQLWRETAESMTVYSAADIAVRFYSGTVVRVGIE
jgi:DNA invertase Pin-like site-specific DNA recombinase